MEHGRVTRTGNTQPVTVTIDPAWLHAPERVFPVQLDLPLVTSPSAAESGLFGTLNSCQPNLPAPAAEAIVGVEGGCTYHGLAYFSLLPIGQMRQITAVQSAILNVYTPNQTGPTGVQVYPNAPPTRVTRYAPLSWQPPSWSTVPAMTANAAGIAQSASNGHWQQWDVTALAQQWQSDPYSNAGVTLVGNGAPVTRASAAGVGDDGPAYAPYLDITFAQPSASGSVSPLFNLQDPVSNIYGLSQGVTTDGSCGGLPQCALGVETGTIHKYWYGSYVRIPAPLACMSGDPGLSQWAAAYRLLNSVYGDGPNLIPLVVFNYPPGNCPAGSFNWATQLNSFANNIKASGSPLATRPQPWSNTYFEIENEPDRQPDWGSFVSMFSSVAPQCNAALINNGLSNGRIIAGGVSAPDSGYCSTSKINTVSQAITAAENNGVPQGRLGVAIHPYGYTTNDTFKWYNYKGQLGRTTTTCTDLGATLLLWTSMFPNLPVFITEINFSANAADWDTYANNGSDQGENGEVAYVADVVTYLDDNGYNNPSTSAVRMFWFTGLDFGSTNLGLYTRYAAEKTPSTSSRNMNGFYYPGLARGLLCANVPSLNLQLRVLSYTYAELMTTGSACY